MSTQLAKNHQIAKIVDAAIEPAHTDDPIRQLEIGLLNLGFQKNAIGGALIYLVWRKWNEYLGNQDKFPYDFESVRDMLAYVADEETASAAMFSQVVGVVELVLPAIVDYLVQRQGVNYEAAEAYILNLLLDDEGNSRQSVMRNAVPLFRALMKALEKGEVNTDLYLEYRDEAVEIIMDNRIPLAEAKERFKEMKLNLNGRDSDGHVTWGSFPLPDGRTVVFAVFNGKPALPPSITRGERAKEFSGPEGVIKLLARAYKKTLKLKEE